jgi:hypothetical protein
MVRSHTVGQANFLGAGASVRHEKRKKQKEGNVMSFGFEEAGGRGLVFHVRGKSIYIGVGNTVFVNENVINASAEHCRDVRSFSEARREGSSEICDRNVPTPSA